MRPPVSAAIHGKDLTVQINTQIALVTGANRGLGKAIVGALVEAGVRKVYAASRTGETPQSDKVIPIRLDVTDLDSVNAAAAACGDVTLLVNNAGVAMAGGPISAASTYGARAEMEVNYFGSLTCGRAFAPVIAGNGGGGIVNVASILGYGPFTQVGTYSASKAAVLSMTQSQRAELAPQKITVHALCPAFVDTDMAAHVTQPKLSAAEVATALLQGLEAGEEEIFPGPAAQMAAAFRADPKSYERRMTGYAPQAL
jgi:NAD(P)-dependent dehydrogenase (short-subunit alcohol dehydrogenase family)